MPFHENFLENPSPYPSPGYGVAVERKHLLLPDGTRYVPPEKVNDPWAYLTPDEVDRMKAAVDRRMEEVWGGADLKRKPVRQLEDEIQYLRNLIAMRDVADAQVVKLPVEAARAAKDMAVIWKKIDERYGEAYNPGVWDLMNEAASRYLAARDVQKTKGMAETILGMLDLLDQTSV